MPSDGNADRLQVRQSREVQIDTYVEPDTAGLELPSFKSAHSCRLCGYWCEGDFGVNETRSLREMGRGVCDSCWSEIVEHVRAGGDWREI